MAFTRSLFICCSVAVFAALSSASGADTDKGFHHHGILVNREQLEFIKYKVTAGAEPCKSAFEAAKSREYGARNYRPKPRQTVECGPYSKPDLGCKDEQRDSIAAYTQALLWFITA